MTPPFSFTAQNASNSSTFGEPDGGVKLGAVHVMSLSPPLRVARRRRSKRVVVGGFWYCISSFVERKVVVLHSDLLEQRFLSDKPRSRRAALWLVEHFTLLVEQEPKSRHLLQHHAPPRRGERFAIARGDDIFNLRLLNGRTSLSVTRERPRKFQLLRSLRPTVRYRHMSFHDR